MLTSPDLANKCEQLANKLTSERSAMMVIIGRFVQERLRGSVWGGRALRPAAPLRVYLDELRGPAHPVFWVLVGFTTVSDAAALEWPPPSCRDQAWPGRHDWQLWATACSSSRASSPAS